MDVRNPHFTLEDFAIRPAQLSRREYELDNLVSFALRATGYLPVKVARRVEKREQELFQEASRAMLAGDFEIPFALSARQIVWILMESMGTQLGAVGTHRDGMPHQSRMVWEHSRPCLQVP